MQNELGIKGGVQLTEIASSYLRESGIEEGFIITRIDKNAVRQPTEAQAYLNQAVPGTGILLGGVYPDGRKAYYPLKF